MGEQGPPDDPFGELIAHNVAVRARSRKRFRRPGRRVALAGLAVFFLAGVGLLGYGVTEKVGSGTRVARTTTVHRTTAPGIGTPTTAGSVPVSTAAPTTTKALPPPPAVRLVIRATRGDSWVEVHTGDAAGRILYSGILRQGGTVRGSGKTLWVRFGSVGNLDLELNGKPVRTAHSGTVDATVTPSGLQ
jgi:Domain of unknown function (DUF4115)